MDDRLLAKGDPKEVIYSVTLREWVDHSNVLRVQADNVDGPFNVSEGGKLELGSTAKFRTLVTYLQVIEELWTKYHDMDNAELDAEKAKLQPMDHLSEWAVDTLRASEDDITLEEMLQGALDRTYSANPAEIFMTGGGAHHFNNFEKSDNGRVVEVREAVRKSINLPFIRIMRDLAYHFTARIPHAREMLADAADPERHNYLARFANKEGREFLGHFYLRYRGMDAEDVLTSLLGRVHKTARHLAAVYAVVRPEASEREFDDFLERQLPTTHLSDRMLKTLYEEMHRPNLSLQDKGYIAGIHPLELWLAAYMYHSPKASFSSIMTASIEARQEAYKWLFNSREKLKQDRRIKIMLEEEAFSKIHEYWAKVGYPFATLIPTYATAIGSSGDKPTALADLMGIIVSGGVQYANTRVTEMDFAAGTPFETHIHAKFDGGTRILSQEVAAAVRGAIHEVVEGGTARRVKGAFRTGDGTPLAIGGKTGTGDNRYSIFAPGGRVIESKVMSRTATFVFYIGDKFFGTLTAYVPNAAASEFNFTSALPVQILKVLAPKLMPLIDRSNFVGPPKAIKG